MEHAGQSAARASGACFVMGQAAGTAAAMLTSKQDFSTIDVAKLQANLLRDGAFIQSNTQACV
jgi:hypothetical protein